MPSRLALDAFFAALFERLDLGGAEIALLVVDDERMRELNARFRGVNRSTDVLSFPSGQPAPAGELRHLGDLAISYPQAVRQAREIGQPVELEIRFLCLHGTLHLLGYDHETDDGEMLRRQSELKAQLAAFF